MLPVELSIGKYLNPGEELEEVNKEKTRRRNTRLAQVHKQASENEVKIVKAVELDKAGKLKELGINLKEEWIKEREEQIAVVGTKYGTCLNQIGQGHEEVFFEDTRLEVLMAQVSQNKFKSEMRGRSAVIEKTKIDKKKMEDLNRKRVLRKKSYEFGNRASQVLLKSSKENLPIIVNRNCSPEEVNPLEDPEQQEDARIAAEKENQKCNELKSLTAIQKNNQEAKEKERYESALKKMQRGKGMQEFINKLEEIDELDENSVSIDGSTSNLDKDREKAVERLFKNFDIPTKLSFYESTPTFERSSRLASNSTSHSDRESPACILIFKPNKRLLPISPSISEESTLPTSSPSLSKSDGSKQFDDSSSIRTDDEKMKDAVLQLHDSESTLAGNLRTPESTIQFSESSSNGWSSSSHKLLAEIQQLQSLKKKLEPMLNTPVEQSYIKVASDQENSLENIALMNENSPSIESEDKDSKILNESSSILSESVPNTFHNVIIFKKPIKSDNEVSKLSEDRNQNLKELVSLALKSKKVLQTLAGQTTDKKQSSELGSHLSEERLYDSSNHSALLQHPKFLQTSNYFPMGIRRRNLELSTIMELDSPKSSTFLNLKFPSTLDSSSIIYEKESNSLFDITIENENGILEEPDLTLVSSITSLGDSTGVSDVPFIVTNVKTNANSLSENSQSKAKTGLKDYKFEDSLSFLNKFSFEQSRTFDSDSCGSWLSDNAGFHSINATNLVTRKSKVANDQNHDKPSYNSSDGNSITDELLSNSMISFLAHEMSANSSDILFDHKT